jgi:23S rRNA (guanosine2251-2'-O)-methyltransferase
VADRLEGRNAVVEALRSGRRVLKVLVADGAKAAGVADVLTAAAAAGVPVANVPRRELDRDSEHGAHQGVVALVEPFEFVPLKRILDATEGRERSLLIALDQVTDPGNLGAVIRTADVAGADGIITTKHRSAAMTPAAYKAAAGAAEHIRVARESNLVQALESCKAAGYWIAAASEHADQLAWDAPMEGRLVIVMGSEGEGLSRLTQRTCDFLVGLPVTGPVGSLNVSAAAAVLAFEWVRRGR